MCAGAESEGAAYSSQGLPPERVTAPAACKGPGERWDRVVYLRLTGEPGEAHSRGGTCSHRTLWLRFRVSVFRGGAWVQDGGGVPVQRPPRTGAVLDECQAPLCRWKDPSLPSGGSRSMAQRHRRGESLKGGRGKSRDLALCPACPQAHTARSCPGRALALSGEGTAKPGGLTPGPPGWQPPPTERAKAGSRNASPGILPLQVTMWQELFPLKFSHPSGPA